MLKSIAFIGGKSYPSQAGVDRVIEAIADIMAARGYSVTIYGEKGKMASEANHPAVKLIPIRPINGKYVQPLSGFLMAAIHAVTRTRYDLVHLHNLEAAYVLPLLRLRYPVVATSHIVTHRRADQWGKTARALIRTMEWPFIHLSDFQTSVSKTDAAYYMRKHNRQVEWIPNGIEPLPEKTPGPGRLALFEKYQVEKNLYLLFVAGRILPTKGAHVFLEAAGKTRRTQDLQIVVLGDLTKDPSYANHLRQIAPKNTIFIPFLKQKSEVNAFISGSKLLVFPSLVEGMSMVLLEAVALKARMVVSDIPENKSVLQDTALYFASEDSDDLAAKIDWAVNNSETMADFARAAYDHVATSFTWSSIADRYEKIYQQAVCKA
jgi:glycosyltransferase involved in cell wall biosynthesis